MPSPQDGGRGRKGNSGIKGVYTGIGKGKKGERNLNAIEFYGKLTQEEIDRIESAKAEFGRRMKSPKKVTEPKEGTGFGDLRYAAWEKFFP